MWSLDSTYEGLKPDQAISAILYGMGLDSTYEGLKHSLGNPILSNAAVWTVPMRA